MYINTCDIHFSDNSRHSLRFTNMKEFKALYKSLYTQRDTYICTHTYDFKYEQQVESTFALFHLTKCFTCKKFLNYI